MKYIAFYKDWSNQRKYMVWLWKHTKPFIASLGLLIGMDCGIALLSVGMSVTGKVIIDSATMGGDVVAGIMLYMVMVILELVFDGVYGVMSVIFNEKLSFGIRKSIYRKILDSSWTDVSKYHTGDLMTRLTSDVNTIATGIAYVIPSIITLFVKLLAAFGTLMYFDTSFAVFALILGPFASIVSIFLGKMVKKLQVKVQETEAAYRSYMQESISNLVVLKAFCGQDQAEEQLNHLRNNRLFWVLKKQKLSVVASTAMNIAYYVGYLSAFAWGVVKLSHKTITFGTMSVFLSLVNQVQGPVIDLSKTIPQIISILASAGRVIELQEIKVEDANKLSIIPKSVSLRVEDLSFGYEKEKILEGVNVKLRAGEFAAIIGTSGIGKTTFIRLIMGFLVPDKGKIFFGDETGREFLVTAAARGIISYVPQGNTLMSGSIKDNLRMGNPHATEEEIWDVLRAVSADQFVKEMPQGMDTLIGEKALGLSEGQAQRIAIARALIRRAPLLILDEATSSLDEKTELKVLRSIRRLEPTPTCILITHRMSVLQFCQRKIEMREGRIWDHEC